MRVELDAAPGRGRTSTRRDADGAPAERRRALRPEERTVVYVEDNLSNLKLVERTLERLPEIRLIPAMHGRLGIDLARQHRPDLILLDLHLPDLHGDEVLERLKARPGHRARSPWWSSAPTRPARQVERCSPPAPPST